jgi:hypothetical protein
MPTSAKRRVAGLSQSTSDRTLIEDTDTAAIALSDRVNSLSSFP